MKQNSTVVREDGKLLRQARAVFGDLVKKAWITGYHYDHMPQGEAEGLLTASAKRLHAAQKKDELRYDNESIVLEFSNGRTIMFSGSEWASMNVVDMASFRSM